MNQKTEWLLKTIFFSYQRVFVIELVDTGDGSGSIKKQNADFQLYVKFSISELY